jgi:hypothetical protein
MGRVRMGKNGGVSRHKRQEMEWGRGILINETEITDR